MKTIAIQSAPPAPWPCARALHDRARKGRLHGRQAAGCDSAIRIRIGAAFALIALSCVPHAESGTAEQLQTALSQARAATRAPAATAAIIRCGAAVWTGASGVTSLAGSQPASTDTRFVLASTTKTVTAAMVLQLVESGRLSLGSKLARFYPGLPNARAITIRQLLNHTSGLPEYDVDISECAS